MPDGGYAWWYLDALSADGAHGLTIIAFIGSVFSPYYAWARRRGPANPANFCAMNIALYGRRGHRWCMTERNAGALDRGTDWLTIGPSGMTWDGMGLTVRLDEIATPRPRRVRGTVRLYPSAVETRVLALDPASRHRWRPIAPCARVEARFEHPALSWSGTGYFDTNTGERGLEDDFRRWDWSRAPVPDGTMVNYAPVSDGTMVNHAPVSDGTIVQYAVTPLAAPVLDLAMHYQSRGGVRDLPPMPSVTLPRTKWRVERNIGAMQRPEIIATLEDTPFYARSLVAADLGMGSVLAVHESLALDRFRAPWVQAMLPFRMPRRP